MKNIEKIFEIFAKNGFECYLVGGCVRDKTIGIEPHDYDFATNALPDEIENIFNKTIPTGKKFGTITVIMDSEPFEITTYRKDLDYSDNRRPSTVNYSKTIEEDLSRRDFTMNAIAYNPSIGYIDPFNGINDITNKVLRAVGNPDDRIKEDSLRILRGLRFALKYDLNIEVNLLSSISKSISLIGNLSKERIQSELMKILEINIVDYKKYSILTDGLCEVIPELISCKGFDQDTKYHEYDVLNHSYKAMTQVNKPLLKLAALLHDVAKPLCKQKDSSGITHYYGHDIQGAEIAKNIMQRLKFSKADIEYVYKIILLHQVTFSSRYKTFNKLINKYDISIDFIRDLVAFMQADSIRDDKSIEKLLSNDLLKNGPSYETILELLDSFEENRNNPRVSVGLHSLAINGNDLIALGIKPGRELGKILEGVLELVVDERLPNDKDKIIDYIKKK